jgi:hypothetical protein
MNRPEPLVMMTNPQFFLLKWLSQHDGAMVTEMRGKMLDALVLMHLARVDGSKVFITEAGRKVLKDETDQPSSKEKNHGHQD